MLLQSGVERSDQDEVLRRTPRTLPSRRVPLLTTVVLGAALLVATALPGPARALPAQAGGDPGGGTTTTTTPPPPPGKDPGAKGDAPSPEPLDPDEIPEPAEPDGEGERGQAPASEVVVGDVAETREAVAALEADLAGARARRADLAKRLRILDTYEADLDDLRAEAVAAATDARTRLADRAVGAYIEGGAVGLEGGLEADDLTEAATADGFVRTVLEADGGAVADRLAEQHALTARLSRVVDDQDRTRGRLARARLQVEELKAQVESGAFAVSVLSAGSEIAITGFVFPVAGPHDFIDSWGYPRPGGRSHEGADIFAERGTPLVAVESGVLARVGQDTLGGTKLWIVGSSGTHYYYAHLDRYAVGVADGVRVEAGEVIGYVGDTGDARGTPPHLHFQLHPFGGEPINPYPLLKVVDDLDREPADRR